MGQLSTWPNFPDQLPFSATPTFHEREGSLPIMKLFECQHCGQPLYFENTRCESCGRKLGYLSGKETMTALEPDRGAWRALADGSRYRCCANAEHGVCNWLIPATGTEPLCVA